MRKVFWCCAAAAVVAAGVACGVADFVGRYPDSFFSRCVRATCTMAVHVNPIARIAHACVHSTFTVMNDVTTLVSPKLTKAPCCDKVKQKPAVTAEVRGIYEAKHDECWDAGAMAEGNMLGRIVIPGEEEIRRALNPAHDLPMPGGIEEAEFVPPFMPHVVDAEDGPGVMEPVRDPEDNLFEFWSGVFQNAPVIGGEESGKQESPCEPIPMPVYDHYHPDYHRYRCPQSSGCCPYSGKCPTADPCPGTGEETSEPKVKLEKKSKKKAVKPGEGCPGCPQVDTMEFRKSDAKPSQFEKKPY